MFPSVRAQKVAHDCCLETERASSQIAKSTVDLQLPPRFEETSEFDPLQSSVIDVYLEL